ncbi:DUF4393 domain-containing protein [Candidatus Saccharibacteria bacterium]|nr:DUF4393 domain-containing protein [Candidatus Saccharibacteria bacterium]
MSTDIKTDLTEPTNKLLSRPAESTGKIIGTILDGLYNTLLLPVQKYNLRVEANLKQYKEGLNKKIEAVPENKKVEPSMRIWGETMESLKWNLDDEQKYIREVFTNILISDITTDKKSKVQPAFIKIVQQLSHEDVKFLELLNKTGKMSFSTIELRWEAKDGYIKAPKSPLFVVLGGGLVTPEMRVIENLERLGLLKWERGIYLTGEKELCNRIFEAEKAKYDIPESLKNRYEKIEFEQEKLSVTDFGKLFLETCLG